MIQVYFEEVNVEEVLKNQTSCNDKIKILDTCLNAISATKERITIMNEPGQSG